MGSSNGAFNVDICDGFSDNLTSPFSLIGSSKNVFEISNGFSDDATSSATFWTIGSSNKVSEIAAGFSDNVTPSSTFCTISSSHNNLEVVNGSSNEVRSLFSFWISSPSSFFLNLISMSGGWSLCNTINALSLSVDFWHFNWDHSSKFFNSEHSEWKSCKYLFSLPPISDNWCTTSTNITKFLKSNFFKTAKNVQASCVDIFFTSRLNFFEQSSLLVSNDATFSTSMVLHKVSPIWSRTRSKHTGIAWFGTPPEAIYSSY